MNARTVQALGIEKALVEMYMSWVMKSMKGMWSRNIMAGLGFGVASGVMPLDPRAICFAAFASRFS